jgi:hypothetical protein
MTRRGLVVLAVGLAVAFGGISCRRRDLLRAEWERAAGRVCQPRPSNLGTFPLEPVS